MCISYTERKGDTAMKIRLREVRERKLMTQDELAERTGVTKTTISRIENDRQAARIPTVRKLAAGLGVDPSELVVAQDAGGGEGGESV